MTDKKKKSPDVGALLQGAGLRRTGARLAVLRKLVAAGAPQSHAEICSALGSSDFDRATVYRNLMDLSEAGLVARTDLGDHIWRFELRGGDHAHPHLVCKSCGDVECLSDTQVEIRAPKNRRALRAANLEVQLKGLCDRCA